MKKLHMGEALQYLRDEEPEFISREVENAHLGLMGSQEVTTYRRADGVTLRMLISNGGCTLEIHE